MMICAIELYPSLFARYDEFVGGALGRTVNVIRQQLSPRERELWFELASHRLRVIQETSPRATRRKSSPKQIRTGVSVEELLVLRHRVMSEEEQAEWRKSILRRTARLLERSRTGVEEKTESWLRPKRGPGWQN
jgi:hypothetical protein